MNPYLQLELSLQLAHEALRGVGQHGATDASRRAALIQVTAHMVAALGALQRILDENS